MRSIFMRMSEPIQSKSERQNGVTYFRRPSWKLQTTQCFDIDHPNMLDPQFVLLATALCTSS